MRNRVLSILAVVASTMCANAQADSALAGNWSGQLNTVTNDNRSWTDSYTLDIVVENWGEITVTQTRSGGGVTWTPPPFTAPIDDSGNFQGADDYGDTFSGQLTDSSFQWKANLNSGSGKFDIWTMDASFNGSTIQISDVYTYGDGTGEIDTDTGTLEDLSSRHFSPKK